MDIPITRAVPAGRAFSSKRDAIRPVRKAGSQGDRRKKRRDAPAGDDGGVVVRLSSKQHGDAKETDDAGA